jgi:hypothetical protein
LRLVLLLQLLQSVCHLFFPPVHHLPSTDQLTFIMPIWLCLPCPVPPITAPMVGARLVLPGPALDGPSVYQMIESHKVRCRIRAVVVTWDDTVLLRGMTLCCSDPIFFTRQLPTPSHTRQHNTLARLIQQQWCPQSFWGSCSTWRSIA